MKAVLRFGIILVTAAALLTAVIVVTDSPLPLSVRALGAATLFSALLPGLRYLTTPAIHRRPIPFLPVIGFIYAVYFGAPFVAGVPGSAAGGLPLHAESALVASATLAFTGWMVMLLAYWESGQVVRARPWDYARLTDWDVLVRAGFLLAGLGLLQKVATLNTTVPTTLAGPLTLLGSLSWIGMGVLVAAWSKGVLTRSQELLCLIGVLVISGIEIGSGLISNPGRFWLLLLLAAWIGHGGRAPTRWWLAGGVTAVMLLVLRGSAMEYRERVWYGTDLDATERVRVYSSILADRFETHGVAGVLHKSVEVVGPRVSQATVLVDVVRRTPASVPYWGGETYLSLAGALVPRFLWPSKPVKDLGQRFGHRYSYLDPSDKWTSFNLPYLVEFYANFGALGVMVGMALVGVIFRFLDDLLNPGRSRGMVAGRAVALGLLVPVMTAVDSDFSLVFGGLILNGLALYMVLRLLTRRSPRVAHQTVCGRA